MIVYTFSRGKYIKIKELLNDITMHNNFKSLNIIMCKIITSTTSPNIELSPCGYILPRLPHQSRFQTLLVWDWMSYML